MSNYTRGLRRILHIPRTPYRRMSTKNDMYQDATRIYMAGIEAVKPANLVRQAVKVDKASNAVSINGNEYQLNSNIYLVGFGKAVFGMAIELHSLIGEHIKKGIVSIPVGTVSTALQSNGKSVQPFLKDERMKVFEGAAHNLPDIAAEETARRIFQVVKEAGEDDLVLALISGGGSALLPLPDCISLQDKRKTIELLTKSGASIHEMNAIRQCLSQVKGGKLAAAAYPAKLIGLILSDIIGDPVQYIASGPTVPQSLDHTLIKRVIETYCTQNKVEPLPEPVLKQVLQPQPSSVIHTEHVHNVVIGNNAMATKAAAEIAKECGYDVIVWSHAVQGEAKEIGRFFANITYEIMAVKPVDLKSEAMKIMFPSSIPITDLAYLTGCLAVSGSSQKICLISSGEPTVTVQGAGLGGRNQELALSFAKYIHELRSPTATPINSCLSKALLASVGTDGQDGPTDAAGAIVDMCTWEQAIQQQLDPDSALSCNDSYNLFRSLSNGKNHVKTGLTGTNVMDIHVLLINHDVQA